MAIGILNTRLPNIKNNRLIKRFMMQSNRCCLNIILIMNGSASVIILHNASHYCHVQIRLICC